ncbi:MAG: hypothetical protein OXG17_10470 [Chloroflexi bacterium]|nr:hypothetical protein [Chloroflexota bacterium]
MPEPIMAFKLIAGHSKGGRRRGFVINEIGHTMVPLAPFHRLMSNSTELFRCNRWRKVLQETTKFTELRECAGENRLRIEAGGMYYQALIEHHMQAYVAGAFARDGFINGAVRLANQATDMSGQMQEEIVQMSSFDDEASERTVLFGVLYQILTYIEYILAIGVVHTTEIEDGSSAGEHLANLKIDLETKVPYITRPKQWPTYSPRVGIDYW